MNRKQRKPLSLKGAMIIIAVTITVIVAGFFILKMNYLLPWQIPLYKDRKAIIEYVRDNHPESKIAEEHIQYRASGYFFIFELKPDCYITFEDNGFQYIVQASNGEVCTDFYNPAKLTAEVRSFIDENFFKPRGIENVSVSCDFGFKEYHDAVPEQWSEYNDSYTVRLIICEQGTTPYAVEWIYDFYQFWEEKMIFPPNWYLMFSIRDKGDNPNGHLYASYKSDFADAEDMYNGYF